MTPQVTPHPLPDGFTLVYTQPHHAPALDTLQRLVFPTLADGERMKTEHYLHHIQLFPEGQISVLHRDRVVAGSSSIRHTFPHGAHRFADISGQLWLDTHQPAGDWLYGMDMAVHPAYRQRGISRAIYAARQQVCQTLGLKGQVIVGLLNGYAHCPDQLDVATYAEQVMQGLRTDPTITAQMRIGFVPVAFVPDYLDDPQCGHAGVLMRMQADHRVIGLSR